MAFLCDVGQQRELAAAVGTNILRKLPQAVLVAIEHPFGVQVALLPGVSRQAMRVEVKKAAVHVLILLITS